MNNVKEIYLLDKTYTEDSIGQQIEASSERLIYAYIHSVSQNEFFNAGQRGFKPDMVCDVWMTEYDGQEELMCDGEIYSIYRTYAREDGRVELYAERKAGDAL